MFPYGTASHVVNAAQLSVWARSAYAKHGKLQDWHKQFCSVRYWESDNAVGFCAWRNWHTLVVGIAGTNDIADVINDCDFSRVDLAETAKPYGLVAHGIDPGTRVHGGFLTHALLCWSGIRRVVDVREFESVWLTGHSLGGAAAALLGYLLPHKSIRCYTYGAPATHAVNWQLPLRGKGQSVQHVRVARVTDPVPNLLQTFVHNADHHLHVRYTGCVRSTPGAYGRLIRWGQMALGAATLPARLAGYSPRILPASAYAGHSIDRYVEDLEAFA